MNPPSQRLQMLAVIKLAPGKMLEFNETMTRVVPIMAQFGWELYGAWATIIGRNQIGVQNMHRQIADIMGYTRFGEMSRRVKAGVAVAADCCNAHKSRN